MVLDQNRLLRQTLGFERWVANLLVSIVKAGIMQYPTGFGKTFVAIMAIKAMYDKHPDRNTIVVVPTTKLKEDWTGYWELDDDGKKVWIPGHIEKHNLNNVQVFVVNTYIKYVDWKCDLFILDEIHHYLSYESKHFSTVIAITKYRFGMGLSATITEMQRKIAEELGWNIVDTITDTEAEVAGYVSNSVTYNLGMPLDEEDQEFNTQINETFKYYFNKFDFEFDILKACNIRDGAFCPANTRTFGFISSRSGKEWRNWWAKQKGWDGTDSHVFSPKNISKYAAQGMQAMSKRRAVLQNMPSKFKYIRKLVAKFPQLKTIIFSESSDFADKVVELFPEKCLAYHTNLVTLAIKDDKKIINPSKEEKVTLKKQGYTIKGITVQKREAFQKFQDPSSSIKVMSVVRAVDEGMDIEAINFAIQAAYNSTERQNTQRSGRAKRKDYNDLGKKALLVNLYMIGTQEEKWLRTRQTGMRMVRWVTSVEEISINQTISLNGGINKKPVSSIEAGNIGTITEV